MGLQVGNIKNIRFVKIGIKLQFATVACACLEQVASLRSARQAHAQPKEKKEKQNKIPRRKGRSH